MNQLLLAILLTIAPISELRGGMPLAIKYALDNSFSLVPIIFLIILCNILIIFVLFFFLDNLHERFMNLRFYKKFYNLYLRKIQKRIDKFEDKHENYGFWALVLFVAIPFPTTGAWTGAIISWILGLERKRSLLAVSLGVVIAGIVVALGSLGFFTLI